MCDVMSCSMADVYRYFVRWPCAMWCHAVWQMFCEMTLCNVMSCSMADVYRCFVRWPCAMWCHAVWQMFCEMTLYNVMSCSMADVYRCFVRWPCAMWCHAVWQMCTDVLWDDPVQCDVMQYGRCVQMFCEMTLCNVMSCSMADVYSCFVRTCCSVEVAHCLLDCFTLHLQQHLWESHSYQALSHPLRQTLIPAATLPPVHHATVSLYIASECHIWVGSFRNVAICTAICTYINL